MDAQAQVSTDHHFLFFVLMKKNLMSNCSSRPRQVNVWHVIGVGARHIKMHIDRYRLVYCYADISSLHRYINICDTYGPTYFQYPTAHLTTFTVRAVMRSYVPESISPPLHRSSYGESFRQTIMLLFVTAQFYPRVTRTLHQPKFFVPTHSMCVLVHIY